MKRYLELKNVFAHVPFEGILIFGDGRVRLYMGVWREYLFQFFFFSYWEQFGFSLLFARPLTFNLHSRTESANMERLILSCGLFCYYTTTVLAHCEIQKTYRTRIVEKAIPMARMY